MMIDPVLLPFRAIVGRGVMYKFKIGERLFPARSCGLNVFNGAYVIVKRLPMRDGEFEYQIRSLTEPDERVVRESQLRSNPLGNRPGRSAAH
jgi:hypothetical protein